MDNEKLSQIINDIIQQDYLQVASLRTSKALVLIEGDLHNEIEEYLVEKQLRKILDKHKVYYLEKSQKAYKMIGERLKDQSVLSVTETNQFSHIIIIKPSISTLSKLAHLIIDDYYTQIIYQGLVCDKKVTIGKLEDFSHLKPALQCEVIKLLKKVTSYGIEVLDEDYKNESVEQKDGTIVIEPDKKLLSLQDIEGKAFTTLLMSKHTVVGPLAQDYIRQKNILVRRNEE